MDSAVTSTGSGSGFVIVAGHHQDRNDATVETSTSTSICCGFCCGCGFCCSFYSCVDGFVFHGCHVTATEATMTVTVTSTETLPVETTRMSVGSAVPSPSPAVVCVHVRDDLR